jgi:hypothetical protein
MDDSMVIKPSKVVDHNNEPIVARHLPNADEHLQPMQTFPIEIGQIIHPEPNSKSISQNRFEFQIEHFSQAYSRYSTQAIQSKF